MSARLSSSLVLSFVVATSACRKAVPEVDVSAQQARVILLQVQQEPAVVRQAIIASLQGRGWSTESENGPEIVGRLSHKGATVRVLFAYDATRFSMKGLEATTPTANTKAGSTASSRTSPGNCGPLPWSRWLLPRLRRRRPRPRWWCSTASRSWPT